MRVLTILTVALVLAGNYSALAKDFGYRVGPEEFQGYYLSLDSSAPLVFIVHDWDGVTAYEKKRADMLVARGYQVFVVDLFGKGIRPTEIAEKQRLTKSLYQDRARMRSLLEGGLKAAAEQGANVVNSVAVGYCFGGASVLEFARSGADLKGFVSFHGGLSTPEGQDYSKVTGSVLIFHGTADKAVSMDEFAELAEQLESAGVVHEMTTYSGAPHAFTVFGSTRYREDADMKSWNRFLEYLDATLDK